MIYVVKNTSLKAVVNIVSFGFSGCHKCGQNDRISVCGQCGQNDGFGACG